MGLWYALAPGAAARRARDRASPGPLVSLVAVAVVVPHYAPGGGSPFEGRYDAVGGSPRGIAKTAVTRSRRRSSASSPSGRDLAYLPTCSSRSSRLPLLAPLAALTARARARCSTSSPRRARRPRSTSTTRPARFPGSFVAAVLGAARLRRRFAWARRPEGRAVVVSTVLAGAAPRPAPALAPRPVRLGPRRRASTSSAHHAGVARRALRLIPPGAAVSATNTLGAHLSERRRVFSFPVLREARPGSPSTEQRPSYRDRPTRRTRSPSRTRSLRARRRASSWSFDEGRHPRPPRSERDRLRQQVRAERERARVARPGRRPPAPRAGPPTRGTRRRGTASSRARGRRRGRAGRGRATPRARARRDRRRARRRRARARAPCGNAELLEPCGSA